MYGVKTYIPHKPLRHFIPSWWLCQAITHAFEESYIGSRHAQRKWSNFLTFSFLSRSRECIHSTSACNVAQGHGSSTECMSFPFTHFRSVDAFKLRVCLSSLLHISCLLVHTTIFFVNHAFTNIVQPMPQWLHWKYHFTWDGHPWLA